MSRLWLCFSEAACGTRSIGVLLVFASVWLAGSLPTGVAAGPAEWTIATAEPRTMRIKNPDKISPEEDERFLRVKKQVFVKELEINRDEINIELP